MHTNAQKEAHPIDGGRTREKVAKKLDISTTKYDRAKYVSGRRQKSEWQKVERAV
jgi:hypothetical protein